MSLKIVKAFTAAIRQNDDLLTALGAINGVGARIFPVARTDEQEKEDKMPYLIVIPTGIRTEGSKDDYEQSDIATVEIIVCDQTFEGLVDLADTVRLTIAQHLLQYPEQNIADYSFSASRVEFDYLRPCYYQTLSYTITI